jgi:hypothetical protein
VAPYQRTTSSYNARDNLERESSDKPIGRHDPAHLDTIQAPSRNPQYGAVTIGVGSIGGTQYWGYRDKSAHSQRHSPTCPDPQCIDSMTSSDAR